VRIIILLIALAIVSGLELLADFRPFPGIWWTHGQAMDYGGLAIIALAVFLFAVRRR
jgi:hypothetical protein